MTSEEDIAQWCEDYLPDIFDVGMFDSEEISERVWDDVVSLMEEMFSEVDDDVRDELTDALHDAADEWFRAQHSVLVAALPVQDVSEIVGRQQIAQHTAEWYAARNRGVSASEFNQLLDGRRNGLLRRKCLTVQSEEQGQGQGRT